MKERHEATLKRRDLINLLKGEDVKNVLYIDDEKQALTSFKALFRRDFNIFTAQSSEEALSLARENNIDVIISDYMMPKVNGLALLNSIKKIKPLALCFLVTALPHDSLSEDYEVLDKPFVKSDIIYKIEGTTNHA
jgi:response regulator RpfG family c-di-GMP phosphodiesterase